MRASLTILSVLLLLPVFADAQQVSFSVTPIVIDVEAEPRDVISKTITVTNNAPHNVSVFATVNEIALNDGGDIIEFKGPTEVERTTAITSWIEITRGELTLKPGEVREVPLTIRMNPNTASGEYHALIGFGTGRTRDDAEVQVKNGQTPRVVVTIRVEDKKVEFVDLEGFSVEKFVIESSNQAISYTLTNPGDTTVVPTGEIVLYDSGGREIKNITANPDGTQLAPGETVELSAGIPLEGMLGRHKAFLTVRYGSGQQAAVYDTAFFYALPWKKLLIIFGGILLVATILTLNLYRRYMRDDDDAEHDDEMVHSLNFKQREGSSEPKDHDVVLTR